MFYAHSYAWRNLFELKNGIVSELKQWTENTHSLDEFDNPVQHYIHYMQPDSAYIQSIVGVIHMLKACRIEKSNDKHLSKLLDDLDIALPDLKDLRDILIHWDSYMKGKGNLQNNRVPKSGNFTMGVSNARIFLLSWSDTEIPKARFEIDIVTLYDKSLPLFTYFEKYIDSKISSQNKS